MANCKRLQASIGPFLKASSVSALILILFCTLFLLCGPAHAANDSPSPTRPSAGGALKLLRISPSGMDVSEGRQIVFEFDRPVVPLGRMERTASEIPIDISPLLACEWRWINRSTLACMLGGESAMAPATGYSIKVRPGIMTEDGKTLASEVAGGFTTERPKISAAFFNTWLGPGTPQYLIRFNLPVVEATAVAHLYFKTRKGVRTPASVTRPSEEEGSSQGNRNIAWEVSPKSALPPDEDVELRIEPGVLSTRGPEPGTENRVLEKIHTFPAFSFLGIKCKDKDGKEIAVSPKSPAASRLKCSPSHEISLAFSSPVIKEEVVGSLKLTPSLTEGRPDQDPWEDIYSESHLSEANNKGKEYTLPLPWEAMKPFKEYRLSAKSGSMKDEFGRPLGAAIDLAFWTDHLPSDLDLYKQFAVLEKGLDTDLPVFVANLKQVTARYRGMTAEGERPPETRTIDIPKREDVSLVVPLGIRGLIGKKSGVVRGELTSIPPVAKENAQEKLFFAQVTPFHVHVKLGHHNSLVWVTDLKNGEPVPGVNVSIHKDSFSHFGDKSEALCSGQTGDDGVAMLSGAAEVDPTLQLASAYNADDPGLFVMCRRGEDMAVAPLRSDFLVSSEGANREYIPSWSKPRFGHVRAWGATAQGVYKVGDTVQYKIYVRDQDNRKFVLPPLSGYRLKVTDPAGKVVHERGDVSLSEFGAMDGEFRIPRNAAVGWYEFALSSELVKQTLEPMRVLVSDFTPSPFHATTDLDAKSYRIGGTVKATTQAKLHAGGPYSGASVRVSASVEHRAFTPSNPKLKGFFFDVSGSSEDEAAPESQTLYQGEGTLNEKGELETEFKIIENPVLYGQLRVESAVRDDRGKSVASRAAAVYMGRDRYVGLSQGDWVMEAGKPSRCRVAVTDQEGNLAEGANVHVRIEWQSTKASRVKGAGDAYLTQYVKEWVKEKEFDLVSGAEPVEFEFTPSKAGAWRIVAKMEDTEGRPLGMAQQRYASGKEHVLWEAVPGNVINVMPEKAGQRVGETARFLVQNPFPGARALITVERLGAIDHWVKTLATSSEILEIPVLPDYVPGFYLSVLVMSPRVGKPMGPEGEDLGKPAFGLGYVTVPVADQYKALTVSAKPEKEVYKPRDVVSIDLEAKPSHAKPSDAAPPIELAVAVLDESVFDLLKQGMTAFDPYQGFYHLDDLDLSNYNLLMQLVGREKLEKKGANPGGGGGPDLSLRSVFKFVSYWNPSIRVDEGGKARIQFEAPDNLTGWRVLVMAVTPEDLMGLGKGGFKVNRLTEIRPALPNQAMEGDSFDAAFTVMNRSETPRTLDVVIQAAGPIQGGETGQTGGSLSRTERIEAQPFKRYTVKIPLKAVNSGEIHFTVRAGDEMDKDGLDEMLAVLSREAPETSASFGMTTGGAVAESVAFPGNIRPDRGRLTVTASPSVIEGLDGALVYLRDYPFSCWEQKISRAAAALLYKQLKMYLGKEFSWPGSDEEVVKILALAAEYQAPNGGMTYYVAKDAYVSPYLSAYTALVFGWLREGGFQVPGEVEARLDKYLETVLRKDESPEFYNKGMAATVRAVALAALAERGRMTREDAERFRPQTVDMSLFGKAMFLQALSRIPETGKEQEEVLLGIMAHGDESTGAYRLTESIDPVFQRIHASLNRDDAAALSAMVAFRKANPNEAVTRDIPLRLMRFLMQSRKGRANWMSTQENLFVLKALADFGRVYESTAPDLSVSVRLDSKALGEGRFTALSDPPLNFSHPIDASDPGRKATVDIESKGSGRLYYSSILTYVPAELKNEPVNAGIDIHREYSVMREGKWTLLGSPLEIAGGETVRVDLYVSAPAERYFAVVEDPVPGGLEPVNRELATSTAQGSGDSGSKRSDYPEGSYYHRFTDWQEYGNSYAGFYHSELRHASARFYSERLGAGRHHLSYTAQAVAQGEFTAMPTAAEEMYDPDVYGKGAPALLKVQSPDAGNQSAQAQQTSAAQ